MLGGSAGAVLGGLWQSCGNAISGGVVRLRARSEYQTHEDMMESKYEHLLELARPLAPLRTAVVHPCDATSMGGALAAQRAGLIDPCWLVLGRA